MEQFIHGSNAAYDDLERRAGRACVVYANQALPPGAFPAHARIGFEVDRVTGEALLMVDRGVVYNGPNLAVRIWVEAGELRFPDFLALRRWIQVTLASAFVSDDVHLQTPNFSDIASPPTAMNLPNTLPDPEKLTDLKAVHRDLHRGLQAQLIDEEDLYQALSKQVLGQEQALRPLARRVARHVLRRQPRRPLTLFAIGPTGVGKTKSAEILVDALRSVVPDGAGYSFLRLDMSEYQERYRVSQLLGSPQGYVGYGEGSQLSDALAANALTVVLFDEIEKAHPDILRTLMNAMDAGRLSTAAKTAHGRERDCRQAIFLFTSNVEADSILRNLEEHQAFDIPPVVDRICRAHLRSAGIAPEMIGRIGGFLVFRPLSESVRSRIVALTITRVAAEYGVTVAYIAPSVIVNLLDQARGGGFGARPDEYLVDEVLGACFAQAAAVDSLDSVIVDGGPPYRCKPLESDSQSDHGNRRWQISTDERLEQ